MQEHLNRCPCNMPLLEQNEQIFAKFTHVDKITTGCCNTLVFLFYYCPLFPQDHNLYQIFCLYSYTNKIKTFNYCLVEILNYICQNQIWQKDILVLDNTKKETFCWIFWGQLTVNSLHIDCCVDCRLFSLCSYKNPLYYTKSSRKVIKWNIGQLFRALNQSFFR